MAVLRPRAETPADWLELRLNRTPTPILEAVFAPLQARVLQVAAASGLLARLARGPADSDELAAELGLTEEGARLLCECLGAAGHVERHVGRWTLSHRARRWFDPESEHSILGYISQTADYWHWWERLDDVVRGGEPVGLAPPQFELARLAVSEVARAIRLPRHPRSVLDLSGGGGWYSAELARRHPGLQATVVEDPTAPDLGGPYDAAIAANVVHRLSPEENIALLRRIHGALAPHGTIAILDVFARAPDAEPDSSALLDMFFHVMTGARTYSHVQLEDWLHVAGFTRPRGIPIRRVPRETLYQARRH